jgi:hypothetical protein
MQHLIAVQQNVRHSGSGEPVVQFGSDAIVDADGSSEDTSREAQTELSELRFGRRTVQTAVEDLRQQIRAQPALPLLPRGQLSQLERSADGDVLEQHRAGHLVTDGLDQQRRRSVSGYRHGDGARFSRLGLGQPQPEHPRNDVAVCRKVSR